MRLLAFLLTACAAALCQPAPPTGPTVRSPEIHPDGRVSFRLLAPKATEVTLRGEWMEGAGRLPLAKNDEGVWSITVGPLPADLYSYSFQVDGLQVVDPRNPLIKLGATASNTSLIDIPGERAAFHAIREVPHGTVHVHHYMSRPAASMRRMHVYTPPGYEKITQTKYPVLYLLHGSGDTDAEWYYLGRSGIILDNLLAVGKARPMLIVMTDGHPVKADNRDPGARAQNTARFSEDLLTEVIPLIERTYRVNASREHRALAGLSMGGMQTIAVGLPNLDKFSHLGVFSAGAGGRERDASAFEKTHAAVLAKPEDTNKKLRLFWIACGKNDFLLPSVDALLASLNRHGIRHTWRPTEGGHTWTNWRFYLAEFLPLLFGAS